jgi:hypothetical protein
MVEIETALRQIRRSTEIPLSPPLKRGKSQDMAVAPLWQRGVRGVRGDLAASKVSANCYLGTQLCSEITHDCTLRPGTWDLERLSLRGYNGI